MAFSIIISVLFQKKRHKRQHTLVIFRGKSVRNQIIFYFFLELTKSMPPHFRTDLPAVDIEVGRISICICIFKRGILFRIWIVSSLPHWFAQICGNKLMVFIISKVILFEWLESSLLVEVQMFIKLIIQLAANICFVELWCIVFIENNEYA